MGAAQQIMAAQKIAGGSSSLNTGIVAYWKMNEVSGARSDSVGTLTLTDNNTVASMVGLISNAADFEKDTLEYFSNSAPDSLKLTEITIGLWVRPETLTNGDGLFGVSNGSNGFNLTYNNGTTIRWRIAATNQDYAHSLSTGVWTLIVVGYSDTGNTMFGSANGAAKSSQANAATATYSAGSALNIGRDVLNAANYFDGGIDEVGVWNRVLSDAEISELYNSAAGKTYPF